jgi:hypothetical protein
MMMVGFSRLGRLISAVRNEKRFSYSEFEHPVWGRDAEGRPLLKTAPELRPRTGAGCL